MTFALKWQNARRAQAREVRADLIEHSFVTDLRFDMAVYPPEIVELSAVHWTRVYIAAMAARMLVQDESARVLDVGSGCGKFCIVGALTTPGQFTGVELRRDLHELAVGAAQILEADVTFENRDMEAMDWSLFNAFYFYNPFYDALNRSEDGLDFLRQVETVKERLRKCRKGTRVVTHHGFGGDMPGDYKRVERHLVSAAILELWVKT